MMGGGDEKRVNKNSAECSNSRRALRMREYISSFRQLRVYQNAFTAAMEIFQLSKAFPKEEKYSLTDQVRRSSRSICANIAESWAKRKYQAAFVAKLSDAHAEANETQSWVDFCQKCAYLDNQRTSELDVKYNMIISQLVTMIHKSSDWLNP